VDSQNWLCVTILILVTGFDLLMNLLLIMFIAEAAVSIILA